MPVSLEKVLLNYKKKYSFDVKIAVDGDKPSFDVLDKILEGRGMVKRSSEKRLPIGSIPLCFQNLNGFTGQIYQYNMEFEYPISCRDLADEIAHVLQLGISYVRVISKKDPFISSEDTYLKNSAEFDLATEIAELQMPSGITKDDVTQKYVDGMIKTLSSKEAKDAGMGVHEVDMKKVKKWGENNG